MNEPAHIVSLADRRQAKIRPDQAEQIRQLLLPLHDEFGDIIDDLLYRVAQKTQVVRHWTFVMLSPQQNQAVVEYLANHSTRPIQALQVWALALAHLSAETNEILLTRAEISERLQIPVTSVTRIMGELGQRNAITTKRIRTKGARGLGPVRYSVNPNVATHLAGAARELAQARAPAVLRDEPPIRGRSLHAQGTLRLVPAPNRKPNVGRSEHVRS